MLPYDKYTGPYNPLDEQLDENDRPLPGQEPYNAVHAISMISVIEIMEKENTNATTRCCKNSTSYNLEVFERK